jgi:hypothetical protein
MLEAWMQVPISPMILRGLHALTCKPITEVLISSLATLLVMAVFSHMTKPTPPVAQDGVRLMSSEQQRVVGETSESSETVDDFLQRVALSHVASLKAPASQAASVAASEPKTDEPSSDTGVPFLTRRAAASKHDRPSASKAHVAASVPKVQPPVTPLATIVPAATAAPVIAEPQPPIVAATPVKAEPLPPIKYGMRLVSGLGTFISVSQTRVAEGMASIGDTLTSLVKKL